MTARPVALAVVATVALLVSLGGLLSGSGVTANRAMLAVMHLAVDAVLIPVLYPNLGAAPGAGGDRMVRPTGPS